VKANHFKPIECQCDDKDKNCHVPGCMGCAVYGHNIGCCCESNKDICPEYGSTARISKFESELEEIQRRKNVKSLEAKKEGESHE